MKKALVLLLAILLVLGLAACGSKPAPAETTVPEAGMANPVVNCVNMNEAETIAGFGLVFATIEDLPEPQISVIDKRIVQVTYIHENEDICLRKAKASDGLSGVYTQFPETSTETVDGVPIALAGDSGRVYCASWSIGNYAYSFSSGNGMEKDIALQIITAMK